jgi:hypothetical protein
MEGLLAAVIASGVDRNEIVDRAGRLLAWALADLVRVATRRWRSHLD